MTSRSHVSHVVQRARAIGGVGVLSLAMLAGTAGFAQAASVVPTPINDGNPGCSDFGDGWTEFKLEGGNLADGTYSDGTLEVTIDNFVNSDSGTPGSFDWSSNIGVDAVFVKAGNDKHNLYVYDPEFDRRHGPQPAGGQGQRHQPHLVLLRRGRGADAHAHAGSHAHADA